MAKRKEAPVLRTNFKECVSDAERLICIRHMLQTDDKWLIRGLLRIYSFQTQNEQQARVTHLQNGVGFSAFDADFLSGIAERVIKDPNRPLTPNQINAVRKAMLKYARQLLNYVKG